MSDNKVNVLMKMWGDVKGGRQNWETTWRQVAQYVAPNKVNVFDFLMKSRGEEKHQRLYDGSPEHYNELLASALHSMLTNPTLNWFELSSGDPEVDKIPAVRQWLQELVRRIHQTLNNSNFQTEIHELYLDLASFGTGVMRILEDDELTMRFMSRPIYEYHIKENALGEVDSIFTPVKMTVRQIRQKYGDDFLENPMFAGKDMKKLSTREFTVVHAVFPRKDAEEGKLDPKNKPFASFHFLEDPGIILKESGFDSFPYVVTRWLKISGEVYGRSPSMKALPDIRMLNAIMRDTIRSAQKVTDPPLMVPDEGMMGPTDTTPGGLNYYRAGTPDRIFPLETRGQPRIGFDVVNDTRERIKSAYFIDQLQLRQADRMTATEVIQRNDEQLRLLGPILGRQHFELLQPLVARIVMIMKKKKLLPPEVPQELQGRSPEVKFVSQIARAQKIAEGQNLNRVMEQVGFIFQADPEALDNVDSDSLIRFSAEIHGLPEDVLRSPEEVQKRRQQRQQEQQQLMEQQQQAADADALQKVAAASAARGK